MTMPVTRSYYLWVASTIFGPYTAAYIGKGGALNQTRGHMNYEIHVVSVHFRNLRLHVL